MVNKIEILLLLSLQCSQTVEETEVTYNIPLKKLGSESFFSLATMPTLVLDNTTTEGK